MQQPNAGGSLSNVIGFRLFFGVLTRIGRRHLMRTGLLTALTFLLVVTGSACGRWGTKDDVKAIYYRNREAYQRMYTALHEQKSIEYVSPRYTPDTIASQCVVKENFPLSENAKRIYREVASSLGEAGSQSVRVVRGEWVGPGLSYEKVFFDIFDSGIGGNARLMAIVHLSGLTPSSKFMNGTQCEQVDPGWYVCEQK